MVAPAQHQSELSRKIDEYLDFLEFGGRFSPLTVRNYTHYLRRFLDFVSKKVKNPTLNNVSALLIESYKEYLTKIGLSAKTSGFHLIGLRSFFKWERKKGANTLNLEEIPVPKATGSKISFLSGVEVERLLNAPDLKNIQGKRDKAIMELLYSTGLRVSELGALNRDDVDFIKKEISIFKDDKKRRTVFLSLRALRWIENYLKSRKDKSKPLFIRHKGKGGSGEEMRLTVRSVQRMIKKYKKKIGLSVDITPKTLRASFATDLLMAGADIRSVQEMLGHKNISTTQIYTHVTNKQLRDIHTAFHGKGR